MKLLLCEDIERLGFLGDIVDVKNGYARNYLLPSGLARVPNETNIRALSEEKVRRASERKVVRKKMVRVAEAVNDAEVVVAKKANEQGHLFGSVTEKDIGENLRAQGYEIADGMVRLDEHIKEIGTHQVQLKLSGDLTAMISVVVVSQDETVEAISEDSESE